MSYIRPKALGTVLAATLLGALVLADSSPAEAVSPFLVVPDPAAAERTPAYRYANMAYRLLSSLVAGKSDAEARAAALQS